jgi:hypothetical protein
LVLPIQAVVSLLQYFLMFTLPIPVGGVSVQSFEMVRRLGRVCAIGISGKEEVSIPYDRGIFKALRYDFCFRVVGPPGRRPLASSRKDCFQQIS